MILQSHSKINISEAQNIDSNQYAMLRVLHVRVERCSRSFNWKAGFLLLWLLRIWFPTFRHWAYYSCQSIQMLHLFRRQWLGRHVGNEILTFLMVHLPLADVNLPPQMWCPHTKMSRAPRSSAIPGTHRDSGAVVTSQLLLDLLLSDLFQENLQRISWNHSLHHFYQLSFTCRQSRKRLSAGPPNHRASLPSDDQSSMWHTTSWSKGCIRPNLHVTFFRLVGVILDAEILSLVEELDDVLSSFHHP